MNQNLAIIEQRVASQPKLDHQGERVITLAMMDEMHQRPKGTAGRNFRSHRGKMLEGRHFFEVTLDDEIRRLIPNAERGLPNSLTLLTERGYLLLVKSFTDDLAWQVQDVLVEHYFRSKGMLASSHLQVGHEIATGIQRGLAAGLKPIQDDMARVEIKVDDLGARMDRIERRKQLTVNTKRQHIDTVARFFGGKCPCCGTVQILDEFLNKLDVANWEHWYAPSRSGPHETWLTCRECNLQLRDSSEFRNEHRVTFEAYQKRREQEVYILLKFA